MTGYENLIAGYRRFRTGSYREQRLRYDRLAQGQSPRLMVIACSDSRVDPTRVFDAGPGEMFVLRNIANLVPPLREITGQSSVAAAVEYAVTILEVDSILVFGHARCGGIQAALAPMHANRFIDRWMDQIAPARDKVLAAHALSPDVDCQKALEQGAVRLSIENLRTYPFVAEAEAAGRLSLYGAIFDIAEGDLRVLDPQDGVFRPLRVDLDSELIEE
ncbi:MAG: carbonic anhydrase [Sphingomonadaceae bacterium]